MVSPFNGISDKERKKLFTLLRTHIYTFDANQNILSILKNDDVLGIIENGYAEITRIDYNGNKSIIEQLDQNSIFGTTRSSIDNNEFSILTKEPTTAIIIEYNKLTEREYTKYNFYNIFIQNILKIINEKIMQKNQKIRILTKKTIRNKLLEYFDIEPELHHSKNIYLSSTFTDLADYLAVDRSAMTRELKSLKDEGFIVIKGKKITLLY